MLLFKDQINKEGQYYIEAFVILEDDNIINSNTVELLFNDFSSEEKNIYLNYDLLSTISSQTGGIFSTYKDIDYFLDNIEFSKSNNVNYQRNNLISYPYLFFIMIILLSVEWYLRNKIGLI